MNTEILCLLDRSGSMHHTLDDAIGGFNRFLQDQRTEPGEARITTLLFNHRRETLYTALPLSDAPDMNADSWSPHGQTALLDAIGYTVLKHAERIRQDGWADTVITCILTDGKENASRDFSNANLSALIREKEAAGWRFVFLIANQDAFSTANAMGMSQEHVMGYATAGGGTRGALRRMSLSTSHLRSRRQ